MNHPAYENRGFAGSVLQMTSNLVHCVCIISIGTKMDSKLSLPLIVVAAFVALTFVLYSATLSFDFVNWGDDVSVRGNFRVQDFSAETLAWFFAHSYNHSYIPVTMISHMVDWGLWKSIPFGHHLTNVLLHLVNTLWVFALSIQFFSLMKSGKSPAKLKEIFLQRVDGELLFSAIVTTALFAVHPLRVESVAWVSSRRDLLCAFFLLPATMQYIIFASDRGAKHAQKSFWLAFALFLLASLSKPVAITFPVVALLLDFFLVRKDEVRQQGRQIVREKIPFFAVSILLGIVGALSALSGSGSDASEVLSPVQRSLLPFSNIVFSIQKLILPVQLAPVYPLKEEGEMLLALVLFVAISILALWLRKRRLPILVWAIFIVLLAPSSVFTSTVQTTADGDTYLPSVVLLLLLGGLSGKVWVKFSSSTTNRFAISVTALLVIGFLSLMNFRQQRTWSNSLVLWGRTIELYPTMPLPYNNFGLALEENGELQAAARFYARAIELKPDYVEAHLNLGNIKVAQGDLDGAMDLLKKAAQLSPGRADVYKNMGIVAGAKGDAQAALNWLKKSVESDPGYADAYFNLAKLYLKMGNFPAATDELKKAALLGHKGAQERLQTQGEMSYPD